jgi:hypothetical protein
LKQKQTSMRWYQSALLERLLFLPPVLIGLVVVVILSRSPQQAERKPPHEQARPWDLSDNRSEPSLIK